MMPPLQLASTDAPSAERRPRRASVVIGGDDVYEDLFTASCELQELCTEAGFVARVRFGAACLRETDGDDLVVLYTAGGLFDGDEQSALSAAIASGTGLLSIHSTALPRHGALDELTGVVFDSHGPEPHADRFTVHIDPEHPLFAGTSVPRCFDIDHEHYRTSVAAGTRVAAWRDIPYGREPLVLTRNEGDGRVCWVQFGHDMRVWGEPAVRAIVLAAVRWSARPTAGIEG